MELLQSVVFAIIWSLMRFNNRIFHQSNTKRTQFTTHLLKELIMISFPELNNWLSKWKHWEQFILVSFGRIFHFDYYFNQKNFRKRLASFTFSSRNVVDSQAPIMTTDAFILNLKLPELSYFFCVLFILFEFQNSVDGELKAVVTD